MAPTEDIRKRFKRFRILVVGRANAGKTTLLQRVCNTTEKPEIFNGRGEKIDASVVQSSRDRGYHEIRNELVFGSNPGFVFHDSCGFEAGGVDEFKEMKEFVLERASSGKLNERIHAIWYCIPMDECHRAITKAEEMFFAECDTSSVPVIAVFTKFDALWDDAYGELEEAGLTRMEIDRRVPEKAKEIFANMRIWDRLRETRYPPKDWVYLAEMEKDDADCGPLLEGTTNALGEEAMQMLLISTQRTNLALCIKYAVEKSLLACIRKMCMVGGLSTLSEDFRAEIQQGIAQWFPHAKWDEEWSEEWEEFSEEWEEVEFFEWLWFQEWEQMIDVKLLYSLKPAIPSIVDTEVSFPLPATKWSFTTLAQALHLGIATTLILEYSFFLLQQDKSLKPAKSLELAAAEYETSGTPAAIQKAVQDFLSQDDGDDEKLCKMMMDITLRNRMSITKVVKK